MEAYQIIGIFDFVCCSVGSITCTVGYCLIPTGEHISTIQVTLFCGNIGFLHNISIMICVSGYHRTIPIFESYRVVNISLRIGCGVGCIASTVNNRLIPTCESVCISVISSLCGRCRNGYLISIVVGFRGKNGSIPILKHHRVVDIVGIVSRCVSCITCTVDNSLIPTCKGVGISIIRCLGRSCGRGYLVTIVVFLSRQYFAVPILEHHSVVDIGGIISCRIGCIACTICNCSIPTRERIRIGIITFPDRISRSNNLIAPVISIGRNQISVPISECDCVIPQGCVVLGNVGSITSTIHNIPIPASKGIGIGIVCYLGRIGRCGYYVTPVIGLGRQNRVIPILKHYGVIDIYGCVSRSIGRSACTVDHFIIPTSEKICIGIICCFGRISRNNNAISPVICLGRDYISIPILEHNRVIGVIDCIGGCIGSITVTSNNILIPTSE